MKIDLASTSFSVSYSTAALHRSLWIISRWSHLVHQCDKLNCWDATDRVV